MEDKKSYYAVIPAPVRYDTSLTANAKLMFGEITALCNDQGFCWASNSYFAKLYSVSNQAISTWIKTLENNGYVSIEYVKKGEQIIERRVSINIDRVSIKTGGGINISLGGYQQNLKDNIKDINNTENINIGEIAKEPKEPKEKKRFKKPTIEEIHEYASTISFNLDAEKFFDYYESKGWLIGKSPMKDWKATVRNWKHNQDKTPIVSSTSSSSQPKYTKSIIEEIAEEEERERLERM